MTLLNFVDEVTGEVIDARTCGNCKYRSAHPIQVKGPLSGVVVCNSFGSPRHLTRLDSPPCDYWSMRDDAA